LYFAFQKKMEKLNAGIVIRNIDKNANFTNIIARSTFNGKNISFNNPNVTETTPPRKAIKPIKIFAILRLLREIITTDAMIPNGIAIPSMISLMLTNVFTFPIDFSNYRLFNV